MQSNKMHGAFLPLPTSHLPELEEYAVPFPQDHVYIQVVVKKEF